MLTSLDTIKQELQERNCYNSVILESYIKAHKYLLTHNKVCVSISGGSDSDIVLDICKRIDPNDEKCDYVWFDTGVEYQATKNHLTYLEGHYGIKIRRERAIKSIPICVKEYGQPFCSKQVSKMIDILQKHNFQWEDLPYEELLEKYKGCKEAIKWWCNKNFEGKNPEGKTSAFNIDRHKYLKEFLLEHKPYFKISSRCCEFAKKKLAKQIYKSENYDLAVVGLRKSEGGIRATVYNSCFTENLDAPDSYRPIFWYQDSDKAEYVEKFNIKHSDCYSKYGFSRTGCVCCPYANDELAFELEQTEKYEPKLYKAVSNIFKDSYEYTELWLKYKKEHKRFDRTKVRRLF